MLSHSKTDKPAAVWFIGGSDNSCGAGVQADLLCAQDFGVTASTVITAVTAQNPSSFTAIDPVSDAMFAAQIDSLQAVSFPTVIKIGLLCSPSQFQIVTKLIKALKQQTKVWVVFDPVMKSSTGLKMQANVCQDDFDLLLPWVDVLTPNAHELQMLSEQVCDSPQTVVSACQKLRNKGVKNVIAKGGHYRFSELVFDFLSADAPILLSSERIDTDHQHGTGCCFASSLACMLGLSYPLEDALVMGKAYVTQGLREAKPCVSLNGDISAGSVAHLGWPKQRVDFPKVVESGDLARAYGICSPDLPECGRPFVSCSSRNLGLYAVVDDVTWIERLLKIGLKTLQLRIKDPQQQDLESQIEQAVELGQRFNAQVFINDYWRLALKYKAYGVHLGQEDIQSADLAAIKSAGLRLGLSTHGYFELLRAHQLRPSYLALGHIFPTTTKDMPSQPQGLERLRHYAALFNDYPLVAIGGIDSSRIQAVAQCGVGSIAVVRAITQAPDTQQAVTQLSRLMYDVDNSNSISALGT